MSETEIQLDGYTVFVSKERTGLELMIVTSDYLGMDCCSAPITPAQAREIATTLVKYADEEDNKENN